MKKLFLFIGVILSSHFFSCKKDSPAVPIDTFLLHPLPVYDSLPLPFTTGSWWKYQRVDSVWGGNPICCVLKSFSYTIELITVIGKAPFVETAYEYKNNIITRTRYDTVNAFMLEVKNLQRGIVDTNYALYYDSSFAIVTFADTFSFGFHVPIIEINSSGHNSDGSYYSDLLQKNSGVDVLNKTFDNCIHYATSWSWGWPDVTSGSKNIYLKPTVGIVYWEVLKGFQSHYSGQESNWYIRRLIDYHIAP